MDKPENLNTEQRVNEMGLMITNLINEVTTLKTRINELEVQVTNLYSR